VPTLFFTHYPFKHNTIPNVPLVQVLTRRAAAVFNSGTSRLRFLATRSEQNTALDAQNHGFRALDFLQNPSQPTESLSSSLFSVNKSRIVDALENKMRKPVPRHTSSEIDW
jgi:hypothetical protein